MHYQKTAVGKLRPPRFIGYSVSEATAAAVTVVVTVAAAVAAAAAAAVTVVASVSAEAEEENKGDYDEPNGRILEEFAKAVHMIHPFINNSL